MMTFTVTLYGTNEHAERNAAQRLWGALEKEHTTQNFNREVVAMLISKVEYEPPGRTHE